jgi:hypothetical protein
MSLDECGRKRVQHTELSGLGASSLDILQYSDTNPGHGIGAHSGRRLTLEGITGTVNTGGKSRKGSRRARRLWYW